MRDDDDIRMNAIYLSQCKAQRTGRNRYSHIGRIHYPRWYSSISTQNCWRENITIVPCSIGAIQSRKSTDRHTNCRFWFFGVISWSYLREWSRSQTIYQWWYCQWVWSASFPNRILCNDRESRSPRLGSRASFSPYNPRSRTWSRAKVHWSWNGCHRKDHWDVEELKPACCSVSLVWSIDIVYEARPVLIASAG